MKVGICITTLLFAATIGLARTGYSDTPDGAQIYSGTCIACHGADGKGVIPGTPDFTGADSPLLEKDDATLAQEVMEGFHSPGSPMAMPPKGGNPALSKGDILAVLKYLRSTFAAQQRFTKGN